MSKGITAAGAVLAAGALIALAAPAGAAAPDRSSSAGSVQSVRSVAAAGGLLAKTNFFGGYGEIAATGKKITSTTASFVIPTIPCVNGADAGIDPGAFLASSTEFTGGGVEELCVNGAVSYNAAIVINLAETKVLAVAPGDHMTVTVSETTASTTVTMKDVTTGATQSLTGTGSAMTQALVGDNGMHLIINGILQPILPVPVFTSNAFSAVKMGGQPLGATAIKVERLNGTVLQLAPGALTGGTAFKVLFKHS